MICCQYEKKNLQINMSQVLWIYKIMIWQYINICVCVCLCVFTLPYSYYLFFLCHPSMLLYQFHWKQRAAKRNIPAATTSTNAIKNDGWGDRPAVAMDNMTPSKLQGTINFPDFMPFKAFRATSSAFIEPDEAAIILVSSGLLLFSALYMDINKDWKQ